MEQHRRVLLAARRRKHGPYRGGRPGLKKFRKPAGPRFRPGLNQGDEGTWRIPYPD